MIEYIHNFDEEITGKSHGSSNIAHYYATLGNLGVIKMIMHYEKINQVLPKDSIFNQLDSMGNNAVALAFFNNQLEVVRYLVKENFHCICHQEKALNQFFEPLRGDSVKRFEQLIFLGFRNLDQYQTSDEKNLAHLVTKFKQDSVLTLLGFYF